MGATENVKVGPTGIEPIPAPIQTGQPASTPAIPPIKTSVILGFIKEHWPLAAGVIALGALYLFVAQFAEFSYGALRLLIDVLVAFLVIHLVFKSTIRPYVQSGGFSRDFNALPPAQKTWMTIGVIAFILFISTECFVHASEPLEAISPSAREQMQTARWEEAQVRPEKVHFVAATVAEIERSQARYEDVAGETGVPWMAIACIHNMECGLSWRENLANGDPLIARTRHVPKGRIPGARPPFTWEAAAIDALKLDGLDRERWSDMGACLQNIEAYNGTGYERFHKGTPTPYLWSWTTLYTRGKYVEDGRWDPYARSEQCGVAAIWKGFGKQE
jgi:lysozyme family protein